MGPAEVSRAGDGAVCSDHTHIESSSELNILILEFLIYSLNRCLEATYLGLPE